MSLMETFLEHDLARLPPEAFHWRDPDAVRVERKAWLEHHLGWCEDQAFGNRFKTHCPVDGAAPDAYLQRIIETEGDSFLAGIRFRGRDTSLPFVDVLTTSWGWQSLPLHDIRREWAPFSPKYARILTVEPPLDIHVLDQVVMAEKVGVLTALPPLPQAPSIQLEPTTPKFARTLIEAGYRGLPADIAAVVSPAELQALQACEDKGLLRVVMVGEHAAGVMAVDARSDFGLQGWCVVEEVLLPAFRGQGLAAPMQRAMAMELATKNPAGALYGTIDRCNGPSQAAAARAGRHPVAAYWFVDL